ncbi:TPA_exp: hypothetical protein A8136_0806 [Trichophyton benhamiae CBS 112371]|nr:TPA_exp: hypothetical protein A8136_0806 [Trichophyton benhamiae CBS 112371]
MLSNNTLVQFPALPAGRNPKADWPVWKIKYRVEGINKALEIKWHHRPEHGRMEETLRVMSQYIANHCASWKLQFQGRWPVWKMKYRAEGINTVLRIEWHHRSEDGRMVETLRVMSQYITNHCDIIQVGTEGGFKKVKPEYCIVFADAHLTTISQTDRPPDKELHICLRFSSAGDRSSRMGYSVHVYVDPGARNQIRQQRCWVSPSLDIPRMIGLNSHGLQCD